MFIANLLPAKAGLKTLFITACATAAVGVTLSTAQAADPAPAPQMYNVEIVVFRAVSPLGVAENWKAEAGIKSRSDAPEGSAGEIDTTAPVSQERVSFQPLSSAQFKLAGTDAALRRNGAYEVLAHIAWSQAATAFGGNAGVSLPSLGVGNQTLRGQVGLEQGRYLHLNVDLNWITNDPPQSLMGPSTGQGPVTFSLKQKRRVRPFEQHYFDHPAFGVIAIVTPAN